MVEKRINPKTKDIIVQFINSHLEQRGYCRHLSNDETPAKHNKKLDQICQSLIEISNELKEFISNSYNERFKESISLLDLNNPDFEALNTVADELFSEDITWFRIMTFLYYGAELSCRAMQVNNYNHEEGEEEEEELYMVSLIIDWMSTYIDRNLSEWISEQEGGWTSVNNYRNVKTKGKRHYFGIAAVAVFVSLYLCSKYTSIP